MGRLPVNFHSSECLQSTDTSNHIRNKDNQCSDDDYEFDRDKHLVLKHNLKSPWAGYPTSLDVTYYIKKKR